MAIADPQTIHTPDELLAMPEGKHFELVGGVLQEKNVSLLSSWVGSELHGQIRDFIGPADLGRAWHADMGLRCFPDDSDKVRRPDVAFVATERLPARWMQDTFLRIAPDLVAEVLSPHDLAYEVDAKVQDYISAGVRLVWVINPETRTVRIHRLHASFGWLTEKDQLDGEDVLPEFCCPVSKLFPTA